MLFSVKQLTAQVGFDPYEIIAHRLRREIMDRLHSRPQTSFSELMKTTGENTGSLSFHLAKLEPLIAQNEQKKYSLNPTGEKMYLIIRQIEDFEPSASALKSIANPVNLSSNEKIIMSSDNVKPLGFDQGNIFLKLSSMTKLNMYQIHMTLTNKRLLLSGQGSFPPMEIPLSDVTLVMIKNEPLNRGYFDGNALEVTYSDQSGKLHWVSLLPPDIERWIKEIQTAASLENMNSSAPNKA